MQAPSASMDASDVTRSFVALLIGLCNDNTSRRGLLEVALKQLASNELRDLEPDAPMIQALLSVPHVAWDSFETSELQLWHTLLVGLLKLPEMLDVDTLPASHVPDQLIDAAIERLGQASIREGGHPMNDASLPGGVTFVGRSSSSTAHGLVQAKQMTHAQQGTANSKPSCQSNNLEFAAMCSLLHWLYGCGDVALRVRLRSAIGLAAQRLGSSAHPPPGLRVLLELLSAIIRGFASPSPSHHALLRDVLIPLHLPSGRLDETTPALALYHEPLVHCMLSILKAQPNLIKVALQSMLMSWPEPREGNSAKEILLLHELERILEIVAPEQRSHIALICSPLLARCIASDNSRLAERALQFFENETTRVTLLADYRSSVPILLGAMLRSGKPHWNDTVNKMTHQALTLIQEADADGFAAAARQHFSDSCMDIEAGFATSGTACSSHLNSNPLSQPGSGTLSSAIPPMTAPWAARKTHPAPTGCASDLAGNGRHVTGVPLRPRKGFDPYSRMPAKVPASPHQPRVCPGAQVGIGIVHNRRADGQRDGKSSTGFKLDLQAVSTAAAAAQAEANETSAAQDMKVDSSVTANTISDAVPAFSAPSTLPHQPDVPHAAASTTPSLGVPHTSTSSAHSPNQSARTEDSNRLGPPPAPASLLRVLAYMQSIEPSAESIAASTPVHAHIREHLGEVPTRLPKVIFQDLVFGRDLGSGSFSTVRYCRHIQRGQRDASWPEYAAKVSLGWGFVATAYPLTCLMVYADSPCQVLKWQLVAELGYEMAVRREIVVLRQLCHPGVARLVASFRWKADIYLLLEYGTPRLFELFMFSLVNAGSYVRAYLHAGMPLVAIFTHTFAAWAHWLWQTLASFLLKSQQL